MQVVHAHSIRDVRFTALQVTETDPPTHHACTRARQSRPSCPIARGFRISLQDAAGCCDGHAITLRRQTRAPLSVPDDLGCLCDPGFDLSLLLVHLVLVNIRPEHCHEGEYRITATPQHLWAGQRTGTFVEMIFPCWRPCCRCSCYSRPTFSGAASSDTRTDCTQSPLSLWAGARLGRGRFRLMVGKSVLLQYDVVHRTGLMGREAF
jgi:hypothetical protein